MLARLIFGLCKGHPESMGQYWLGGIGAPCSNNGSFVGCLQPPCQRQHGGFHGREDFASDAAVWVTEMPQMSCGEGKREEKWVRKALSSGKEWNEWEAKSAIWLVLPGRWNGARGRPGMQACKGKGHGGDWLQWCLGMR